MKRLNAYFGEIVLCVGWCCIFAAMILNVDLDLSDSEKLAAILIMFGGASIAFACGYMCRNDRR